MESIVNAITKTIPISMFNRGLAGKIFSDVKTNGPKVVMKNNAAEVVLISPAEYIEMMKVTQAKRPFNSQMSKDKLKQAGISVPEWKDGLKRYLEEAHNEN